MPQSEVRKLVVNKVSVGAFAFNTKDIPVDVGDEVEASVFLDIVKNAGVFSLTCDLISQDPITKKWVAIASFPTINTAGTRVLRVADGLGKKLAIDVNQSNGNGNITWNAALAAKG